MPDQSPPSPSLPAPCRELATRGQWLDSWQLAAPHWAALVARGDLADQLWLHELCLRLGFDIRRRWVSRAIERQHGTRRQARASRVCELLRTGRLLEAWSAIQPDAATLEPATDAAPTAADDGALEWLLARARVYSNLRDHAATDRLLQAAASLAPDDARVVMEVAWAHQDRDQLDAAMAGCRAALAANPNHPSLRLQLCWLMHDANDPSVGDRLAEACATLQSPVLRGVLASHCLEHGDPITARALWTALVAEPHHERRTRQIWRIALVRTCRELGADEAALEFATAAGTIGATYAERLRTHLATATPRPRLRMLVPVPFVRQDFMTCSPATMASLLQTFGVVVDQREIAAQITYDGTASHDELAWARSRGLDVRFFQFDPEIARALLDQGLPFAITTRFETNSHRQAVCGYDRVLDTFVLRDPTGNFRREVDATWLAKIAGRGGECALLLPTEVAARCQLPPLPQEAATTEWLQLQLDWRERRLGAAERHVESLLAEPPGPLRFDVEMRVCHERGDRRRQLELWQQAFAAAPDDPYWQFHYAAELIAQHRWQDARNLLEGWLPKTHSPHLRNLLVDQWRHDARLRPAAERLLRRALRQFGRDARSWQRFASLLREEPTRREEAAELTRLAGAMAPHDEWLALSYFQALHDLGRAEAGLDHLRDRCTRFAAKSAAAAATLAQALETLHRPDEAIAVLQAAVVGKEALDERERLCRLLLRYHRAEEAAALLAEPHGLRPLDRALCRHALAQLRGDHKGAQAALVDAVDLDPWHTQAQRLLLEHRLEHDGPDAAVAAADALVSAHADCPPLMVAVAEFFGRLEDRARSEALLRRLVHDHPHEHWLRGRLARLLVQTGQIEAARPLLDELRAAVPDSSPVWLDLANFAHATGDPAAARAAARRAFELAPDNGQALRRLVDWAKDAATAADDVRFAMHLLANRPIPPDPDTLADLSAVAEAVPRTEFLAFLSDLERNFPSTTAPTVARCEFVRQQVPEEALPIAAALVARHPWDNDHWLRHAACLRACRRLADEQQVLEQLLQRDPACAQGYVELGESFEQEGRQVQAMAAFERGLAHVPGHAVLHGMVANAAWDLGLRERALAAVSRACDLDRHYTWAYHARVRWLIELDRQSEALAVAEQLVLARPRSSLAHDLHAIVLDALGRHEERVQALRTAVTLSPRNQGQRLRLLDVLIGLKRFDDARAALAEGRERLGEDPLLLLRDAQIERTAGRIVAAREQLRALLDKFPDCREAWLRYLTWCEQEGRHTEILQLHQKPPAALREEAVLFGYAADALRQRGDLAAADAALARALELAPGYQWARDSRCDLALERGKPALVLELLPDHKAPLSLPFQRAVLVAKAAVRLSRFDLAEQVFARLLQEPTPHRSDLGDIDALLRKHDRSGHDARLRQLVKDAEPGSPVAANHLRVLAARQQHREFWPALTLLHDALGADRGIVAVAALLADIYHLLPSARVAQWVHEHVTGPVLDTEAMGNLLYALSDTAPGSTECVRLFADDWQRPDVRGWMLANLAEALRLRHRLEAMAEVSRYALATVPHDHSYWWHRRYLAEAALHAGHLAEVRELCTMPIQEHARLRLAMHQLDLVAELRTTPWWRRNFVMGRRLAKLLRHYEAARKETSATQPRDLRPELLLRACPGPITLLLSCGRIGLAVLRYLPR